MKWLQKSMKWVKDNHGPWVKNNLGPTRLSRIPKLTQDEIAHLRNAGVADQDDLQGRIDGNSGVMFHTLEASTGLSTQRLLQITQQSLALSAKPTFGRRARAHAMDFIVASVIAIFVLAFVFPPKRPPQVIASRDIPAFHQIESTDLEEIPPRKPPDVSKQYAGKYSLERISKNSQLHGGDLAAALVELRVEIKSSAVADNSNLPQPVLLVFSSHQPAAGGIAIPALLSGLEQIGSTRMARLRISAGQQSELAKWLGSADAHIMLPVP